MRPKPVKRGVYALIVQADRRTRVRIGRLGHLHFRRGVYVYVGSAMNSLQGRISRYYGTIQKRHWHIDYLLRNPTFRLVEVAVKVTSRRLECQISRAFEREAVSSVGGFGCSDCNCESHLHYFKRISNVYGILTRLGLETILRRSSSAC